MATKQSSLRASKQAKRQTRVKQKKHADAKAKQLFDRELAKKRAEQAVNQNIGEEARLRLKQLKKRVRQGRMTQAQFDAETAGHEKITNTVVMQNINDVIPAMIRIHSGVEVFIRLADEKRIVVTQEEHVLIQTIDQQITHVTEDINAIVAFVSDKKEPEDYMEIFIHYTELLATLFESTVPGVMAMITPHEGLIDQYANEHRNKEMPLFDFMRGLHCERMEKVFKLYHTPVSPAGDAAETLHAYTPDNPMPVDPVVIDGVAEDVEGQDRPLIDEDVTDAVLAEVPDLEQDVETHATPIA